MKHAAWLAAILGLLLFPGTEVRGQVPWEAPMMLPPSPPGGLSLLLTDPAYGLGVVGMWQGRGGATRVGYRVGLAEDRTDDLAVLGGVDLSGRLVTHSQEFPLDVVWLSGVGIGFSDEALITIPIGLSVGRELTDGEVQFQPYASPRLVVDGYLGDDHCTDPGDGDRRRDCDDLDLGLVVDVGLDLAISSRWLVRFGASVGDREALAIGLAFPLHLGGGPS